MDALEGRQVLSQMMGGAMHPAMMGQMGRGDRAPQNSGVVTKAPMFYEHFAGNSVSRIRLDLDVVKASARVAPGQGLMLSGTMVGKINRNPADASQSAFYVFGINRGIPGKEVAPFDGRPGINFDTVVVVSITPSGITGMINDLANGTQQTIDPRQIHVSGHEVRVTVNPTQLQTLQGNIPLSQDTFNLWPRDSLAMTPSASSHVASFIPENSMAPIRVPPGQGR